MDLRDFKIGQEFTCAGKRWRCTDTGSRVVVAIKMDMGPRAIMESWYNGPPYAVPETVFDENDLPACSRVRV